MSSSYLHTGGRVNGIFCRLVQGRGSRMRAVKYGFFVLVRAQSEQPEEFLPEALPAQTVQEEVDWRVDDHAQFGDRERFVHDPQVRLKNRMWFTFFFKSTIFYYWFCCSNTLYIAQPYQRTFIACLGKKEFKACTWKKNLIDPTCLPLVRKICPSGKYKVKQR